MAELTERQLQVLRLLSEGKGHSEIGRELKISPNTVHEHCTKIYRRLEAPTRPAAVAIAVRRGWI